MNEPVILFAFIKIQCFMSSAINSIKETQKTIFFRHFYQLRTIFVLKMSRKEHTIFCISLTEHFLTSFKSFSHTFEIPTFFLALTIELCIQTLGEFLMKIRKIFCHFNFFYLKIQFFQYVSNSDHLYIIRFMIN